jgi:16S rRNA (cytidine1402-2'-O)-methyltransferase
MAGRLIMCATPIGNLGDVSRRLVEALEGADVVFAEDTRRSATLLRELGVDRPMRSYFAGNEEKRGEELTRRLGAGETVVLLTDAGTPGVSDPGYSAIQAAVAAGAEVGLVPGPSAVTAALSVAGLPADRFVFEGFLPRRGAERSARLANLAHEPRTIVLFCSPNRLLADLGDLAGVLGEQRRLTVGRELTKLHEEVWRGTIAEALIQWNERPPRGEFVLVVAGSPVATPAVASLVEVVAEAQRRGVPLSQAVREVSEDAGVKRRLLYEAVLRSRDDA